MNKIRICFEIFGLGEDENGNRAYAGACLTLGETEKEIDYAELVKNINKGELLELCLLGGSFSPDDVRIITPEEYDSEYGSDDAEVANER